MKLTDSTFIFLVLTQLYLPYIIVRTQKSRTAIRCSRGGHCRPWTFATAEESPVRCRSLRRDENSIAYLIREVIMLLEGREEKKVDEMQQRKVLLRVCILYFTEELVHSRAAEWLYHSIVYVQQSIQLYSKGLDAVRSFREDLGLGYATSYPPWSGIELATFSNQKRHFNIRPHPTEKLDTANSLPYVGQSVCGTRPSLPHTPSKDLIKKIAHKR
ncbi:hypothetical protein EVAR_64229_1 [Eumeta japonica]|uniref:Uncharacterized protein n=1 Tax=Eumeta variegata TaxID=151549 RepID=A0A4C1ZMZ9_EUMVA|nr:hypothetical protein EVAR_64229_1 [Eumeta japonica]